MEVATRPGHAISEVNLKIVMSRETFRLLSDLNYGPVLLHIIP
jgi:hypothetical protein